MDVHHTPGDSMAGYRKRARKPRTRFTIEQMRLLSFVSQKTLSPDLDTIQRLATEMELEKYVIQVWFKNQRAKRKRMNSEKGCLPASRCHAGSEGGSRSPPDSLESPPSSAGTCSPLNLGAPLASDGELPRWARVSQYSPALDSESKDPLDEIHLRVTEAPWASHPQAMDEFIQTYMVPGDDDLAGLDQYLLPLAAP